MRTLIASIEKRIIAQHRSDEASKRLRSISGIGLVGATAIVATITDPKAFRSGRDMAAWIGLVPRQDSTGGKQKLGLWRPLPASIAGGAGARPDHSIIGRGVCVAARPLCIGSALLAHCSRSMHAQHQRDFNVV